MCAKSTNVIEACTNMEIPRMKDVAYDYYKRVTRSIRLSLVHIYFFSSVVRLFVWLMCVRLAVDDDDSSNANVKR